MVKHIFFYAIAALFLCYEMALQVSPSIMTYDLMRDFQINASVLGLMASCYFYSYTLMQVPAGMLYDRFSPRLIIATATLICAFGALFFGATETVWMAAFGRFLMGFGSAFAFLGVLTVASHWFKPFHFAFLVGLAQFLAAVGAAGGEYPLAALVQDLGWRHSMELFAYGGIGLALVAFLVLEKREHEHELSHFFSSLGKLFRWGQNYAIALYAFCSWGPMAIFGALWGVPFLVAKYGVSNVQAAGAVSMVWLGVGLASPFAGYFSDRWQRRRLPIQLLALLGLVSSSLVLYVKMPLLLVHLVLFFFGVAVAGQILTFALMRENNRPAVTTSAMGVNNMAVVAGGALLQPLVGYLVTQGWDGTMLDQVPVYSVTDFEGALLLVPLCFALAFLVTFVIRETYCKSIH